MRLLAATLGGAAWLLAATGSLACSVSQDFVRATNYELVEGADAVVVAVAESERPDRDGPTGSVIFRVAETLKGSPPEHVSGWGALGRTTPSDPNSIVAAHPESFEGACSRYTFQRGQSYVLFLKNGDGVNGPAGWYAAPSIFARSSEDYAGPNSLWMRAIRTYLDVQSNPDRMGALEDLAGLLPGLEAPGASEADRKLAADIRDHLGSLSPSKPTAYLVAAYEALERGESPRFPIRGGEANREGGAADAATDLIFDVRHPDVDLAREKEAVLRSLVNGDHPAAIGLFERLLAEHPDVETLGQSIRYLSNNGQVRRAFELSETEGMRRLGALPSHEASALVGNIAAGMRGKSSGSGNEAWRADPYVAARWPEMALSLYWMDQRLGWGGHQFREPIEALRPVDYRSRPEVTIALASSFDEAVEAWAVAETDRLVPAANWLEDEDPAWLPLRVLVTAYGRERDEALERAFCSGESGRIMLVQTLGMWGDDMDQHLLKRMLVTPGLDEESLDGVRKALAMIYGRHASDRNGLFRDYEAYEAIKASLTGAAVESYQGPLRAIACPRP